MSNSSNNKLGEFFVRLPKVNADGSNYVIVKDRIIFTVEAAGLQDHLDESKTAPTAPAPVAAADVVEAYQKKATEWRSGEDLR